jgi:type II secretory pathway pseudopilin PulG
MIEMLGVLAIIGVLSVGGIAGYSKAMTKFKINKTIDEVSQIAANVRTLYSSQGSYNGLNEYIVKKAKLVPEDVFKSNGSMLNPFGGSLYVDSFGWNFLIVLSGIPEDACMELATLDWSAATSSGLNAIGINKGGVSSQVKNCSGNINKGIACVGGGTLSVPMSVSVAAQLCSGDSNYFELAFY